MTYIKLLKTGFYCTYNNRTLHFVDAELENNISFLIWIIIKNKFLRFRYKSAVSTKYRTIQLSSLCLCCRARWQHMLTSLDYFRTPRSVWWGSDNLWSGLPTSSAKRAHLHQSLSAPLTAQRRRGRKNRRRKNNVLWVNFLHRPSAVTFFCINRQLLLQETH